MAAGRWPRRGADLDALLNGALYLGWSQKEQTMSRTDGVNVTITIKEGANGEISLEFEPVDLIPDRIKGLQFFLRLEPSMGYDDAIKLVGELSGKISRVVVVQP